MCASRVALSFACLSLTLLPGLPVSAEPQVSVFRLQAPNAPGVREGTCFVIRQEKRAEGTFLALVTSARLFDRETGRRARVFIDGERPVEITQDAISAPYDNMRDIAVLEAVVEAPPPSTLPVVLEPVPAGTPFFVAGVPPDGSSWRNTCGSAPHVP